MLNCYIAKYYYILNISSLRSLRHYSLRALRENVSRKDRKVKDAKFAKINYLSISNLAFKI